MYILILLLSLVHILHMIWDVYNNKWQQVTILNIRDIEYIAEYVTLNKHIFYNNENISLGNLNKLRNYNISSITTQYQAPTNLNFYIYHNDFGTFYPFYDSNYKISGFLSWNKKKNNNANTIIYPIFILPFEHSITEYLNNIFKNLLEKKNIFYMTDHLTLNNDLRYHDCIIHNLKSKIIESNEVKLVINYITKKFEEHPILNNLKPHIFIMLVGPSGCGKSTLITHVAKKMRKSIYIPNMLTEQSLFEKKPITVFDNVDNMNKKYIEKLIFFAELYEYCNGITVCTANNIDNVNKKLLKMFNLVVNMDHMDWLNFNELCKQYFGRNSNISCSQYKKINNSILINQALSFLSIYDVDTAFNKYMNFIMLEISA